PIRQTSAREIAGRIVATLSFTFAMHPHQFAGSGVQSDDRAARSRSRIHDAVHHEGCRFQVCLWAWAKALGLEAPCNLKLIEIGRGDLVECRVVGVSEVCSVGSPLSVFRTGLSREH